jgi:hypothetical protein
VVAESDETEQRGERRDGEGNHSRGQHGNQLLIATLPGSA